MPELAFEVGESITMANCEPDAPVDSGVSKGDVDAEESDVDMLGIKKKVVDMGNSLRGN